MDSAKEEAEESEESDCYRSVTHAERLGERAREERNGACCCHDGAIEKTSGILTLAQQR